MKQAAAPTTVKPYVSYRLRNRRYVFLSKVKPFVSRPNLEKAVQLLLAQESIIVKHFMLVFLPSAVSNSSLN